MGAQHEVIEKGDLESAVLACASRVCFVAQFVADFRDRPLSQLDIREQDIFEGSVKVLDDVAADLGFIASELYDLLKKEKPEEVSDGS